MNEQVVIYLKSGQSVNGQLARTFKPNDIDIEILTASDQGRELFSLEEVCVVAFAKAPSWLRFDAPDGNEQIQTTAGKTFHAEVFSADHCRLGFFGLLLDKTAPCRTVFFTFSGVRSRNQERHVGQILIDDQLVSQKQMSEVLDSQERLRKRRLGEVIAETAEVPMDTIEKTLKSTGPVPATSSHIRVGDILVESGLVTREQVEKAFASQEKGKKLKVGELLVSRGLITEKQLLKALADKFRLRFVDLSTLIPSPEALDAISEGLVGRLQIFPLELNDRTLVVATSAPTDPTVRDALGFSTGYAIELVVATEKQIVRAIETYYRSQDVISSLLNDMDEEAQSITVQERADDEALSSETDSTVIAVVNRLLVDAYKRGASDIHFEPDGNKNPILVRYRIDGECEIAHRIASTYKGAIVARLKIISGLDITERRRPQSGKILLHFQQRKLEYRVEVTPTVGGLEDVVLRLLSASKPLPLAEMGFMPYNLERFRALLEKPYGMILCVGPTGSGKTTTLHSALSQINTPKRKIWTVEDPVEITQAGLRQVQVNRKVGFSFAEALRSFLRADPDVIMIGEMRDVETAKIAIEASLTGHLVFSTLHTNSAPETVVRLVEMGLDPFNFADALLGITAQRLARRLCASCKEPLQPTREVYDELLVMFEREADRLPESLPAYADTRFMAAKGCDRCNGSGYRGRIALHELLLSSSGIKRAIRNGLSVEEVRQIALEEGMWTLRMDGIMKIFSGETDLEQVNKVCI
ncbi:GspE/PulE family protein [Geopsychrobacter electrodiphilus]|uniref:GspE/PulE family protein n=1 Tax=Geopsychrobacter electrodiphilus TaxID=225196 RepID=UPI00036D9928|nr:ATPase, T2SS/T4P/T4SS family [Geopsychrobacter electrodiphilus]